MQIIDLFPVLKILDSVFNPITDLDQIIINNYKLANQKPMTDKFAKLFDLGEHQVLLTYHYDSENEQHELIQSTCINGIQAEIKASFHKDAEEAVNLNFENFNEESAAKFLNSIKEMLS